jgi:tetratricopeptide (TPR) repeat protein
MPFKVALLAATATVASITLGQGFPDKREIQHRVPHPKVVGGGSVRLQDGSPAPVGTPVQLVCPGLAQTVSYTNAKGEFRGGSVQTSVETVSTRNPLDDNCRLSALLPGYVSSLVPRFGGSITLRAQSPVEGATASMTGIAAPPEAKKLYQAGLRELRKKKYEKAAADFSNAVELHPLYADAWVELGLCLELKGDAEGALRCYTAAAGADPAHIQPPLQTAGLAMRLRRWQESAAAAAAVIRLDPGNYPQAYFYHALASYNLQTMDIAEQSARQGQRRGNLEGLLESARSGRPLDAKHAMPKLCRLLAIILAERGDYRGSAEQLRAYATLLPKAADAREVWAKVQELETRADSGRN